MTGHLCTNYNPINIKNANVCEDLCIHAKTTERIVKNFSIEVDIPIIGSHGIMYFKRTKPLAEASTYTISDAGVSCKCWLVLVWALSKV